MIPNIEILNTDFEIEKEPSKNYKMEIEEKNIIGTCDNLESLKQVIYKILNTERYQYVIYSWNYGIELVDLIGEPATYVCAELPRRITEALIQDDRINGVDNFEFDLSKKGIVEVTFIVNTIFGNIEEEMAVNY